MANEILRDRTGKVIGQLKEAGDTIKLYGVGGRFMGQYRKSTNTTYDAGGRVVAKSNLLVSLLRP